MQSCSPAHDARAFPLASLFVVCLLLQDLVAECPAAKELFDKAADILGYDLLKVRRRGGIACARENRCSLRLV